MKKDPKNVLKTETLVTTLACASEEHRGVVSLPVYRASTILFPTLDEFEAADRGESPHASYGRYGTRSTESVEDAMAVLEGADHSIAVASGIAAITVSLMAFLKAGDHLLMVDSAYGPTRRLCDNELKRFGVETTYYDPTIGAGIAELIRDNTRVVFVESPGSHTFEMQDVPAIAAAAHARGAIVIADNTWATPLYIRPFELGVDVSVHSATKYISGHSDLVMGIISCKAVHYKKLLYTFRNIGARPSGDECYLAMRGLRSMAVRVPHHFRSAMTVAQWLQARPEVDKVLYPALPGAPGHDIWKRDFKGATSLFSIILKPDFSHAQLAAMLDNLQLFGMGYSWGGFESLVILCKPQNSRTAKPWNEQGYLLRLHIGLEHTDDLIADLEAGFARLNAK
jgi:cysteine-S-conjugate beta-lyase